jgi:hypothetical protein
MEGEMRTLSWSLGMMAILLNYASAHPCTLLCLDPSDLLQATCFVDLKTDVEVQNWGEMYPSTSTQVGQKIDLTALNAPTSLTCPTSQIMVFGEMKTVTPLRIFGTIKQGTVRAYSTPAAAPGVGRVLVDSFENTSVIVADPKTIKD